MFHYAALYNSVNMKITHRSIHVMESFSAVKKEVTNLKGSHAKIIIEWWKENRNIGTMWSHSSVKAHRIPYTFHFICINAIFTLMVPILNQLWFLMTPSSASGSWIISTWVHETTSHRNEEVESGARLLTFKPELCYLLNIPHWKVT